MHSIHFEHKQVKQRSAYAITESHEISIHGYTPKTSFELIQIQETYLIFWPWLKFVMLCPCSRDKCSCHFKRRHPVLIRPGANFKKIYGVYYDSNRRADNAYIRDSAWWVWNFQARGPWFFSKNIWFFGALSLSRNVPTWSWHI